MAGPKENSDSAAARRRTAMIAIAWFVRMRSADRTPEDERRFRDWLAEDSGNEAAFAGIEAVWDRTGDMETLPGLQVMRHEARRPRTGFLARAARRSGRVGGFRRPAGRVIRGVAAAAAVAAAVALTAFVPGLVSAVFEGSIQNQIVYRTESGQRSEFAMEDGSRVTLTSNSRLIAHFTEQERRVILARGQAFFSVAHDPDRPFRVEAGSGAVTALGTQFDIYKRNGEVIVTLIEGLVEVAATKTPPKGSRVRRLNAGERVSYGKSGLSEVRHVNIERATAWRHGRINVVDVPLLEVIDEMNRHSCRKLRVDRTDPELKRLLVTGQFRTGRPELLVQYIRAAGKRVSTMKDAQGNIILRLRGSTSTH